MHPSPDDGWLSEEFLFRHPSSNATLNSGPAALSCDRSWLPKIQKFLPHSWVDSALVTNKATKRNNAGVPVHLWDQRYSLVLPNCTPAIPILRALLARKLVT
jgi:hypothetical protein